MPNLAALDRLDRIEDQRHNLLGTYASYRSRIEVIPAEVIEARIAENEEMIRRLERDLGLQPGERVPIDREASDDRSTLDRKSLTLSASISRAQCWLMTGDRRASALTEHGVRAASYGQMVVLMRP